MDWGFICKRKTRVLHRSNMVKKELSIYWCVFIPSLNYGNEIWVVTEGMRLWIQAAEISLLQNLAGLSYRHRARSLPILRKLGVEPPFLQIRSQLGCLGIYLW